MVVLVTDTKKQMNSVDQHLTNEIWVFFINNNSSELKVVSLVCVKQSKLVGCADTGP